MCCLFWEYFGFIVNHLFLYQLFMWYFFYIILLICAYFWIFNIWYYHLILPLSFRNPYLLQSLSPLLQSLPYSRGNYILLQGCQWYHQYIFCFLAVVLGMIQVGVWVIVRGGCDGLVIFLVLENISCFLDALDITIITIVNSFDDRPCGKIIGYIFGISVGWCYLLMMFVYFVKSIRVMVYFPHYGYIIIILSVCHVPCDKPKKLIFSF